MRIDLVAQGKGGVGKSFVASLLAQHFMERGVTPICVDTDPVNQTFAGYAAYNVECLEIMDGEDINPRSFDRLIERIVSEEDPPRVMAVDNGAATFVPLCSYLASSQVISFLTEQGHEVRLHTVLTGGQALEDTFNGLATLAANFASTPIVVWLNEFFGPLARDGNTLEKSADYALQSRIYAEIRLTSVRKETFGHDIEAMLSSRLTFGEAVASPKFPIMARQRLKMVWRAISAQMAGARL